MSLSQQLAAPESSLPPLTQKTLPTEVWACPQPVWGLPSSHLRPKARQILVQSCKAEVGEADQGVSWEETLCWGKEGNLALFLRAQDGF